MIESLKVRTFLVLAYLIFSVIWVLPNMVELPKNWWFTKEKINYGLDIQGGAHLVMGVDVHGVQAEKISRLSRSLGSELTEKSIAVKGVTPSADKESVIVELGSASDKAKVETYISETYGTTLQVVEANDQMVRARYFDAVITRIQDEVVAQAIEVIRNRIDEFGVSEPLIAAQGSNRILIQLPGIKDSVRAKELINRTARLDFRIVSDEIARDKLQTMITDVETKGGYALGKEGLSYSKYVKRLNEDLQKQLPANTVVAFEKADTAVNMEAGRVPYLLRTDSELSGDQLEDAHVGPGEYGEPEVIFKFDVDGRRRFAELTGANTGKQMAIVLDEVVQSAPVIQGKINSDSARITLNRRDYQEALNEANFISTALRAGALPAALEQLEERTVGPTLGQDSIDKGRIAGAVGITFVFLFIAFYYKAFGIVAAFTLVANLISLIAVLSAIGATITLPGVAGIVLTIGMAVDSNVIIFERIKEEMAKGSHLKAAIADGFKHAFSAIWDSNVTLAMTAGVLIYYGTGPVRGFGVTLLAGIFTSLITAIFVTHAVLDWLTHGLKVKRLPI